MEAYLLGKNLEGTIKERKTSQGKLYVIYIWCPQRETKF